MNTHIFIVRAYATLIPLLLIMTFTAYEIRSHLPKVSMLPFKGLPRSQHLLSRKMILNLKHLVIQEEPILVNY